jgi:hypothetical protein
MKAKKTARGEEKERLKKEYERQGMSETQASNKANYEIRKGEGKTAALEKAEVKQDRDTSRFISGKEKGGSKTLAVQARDTGEGGGRAGQMLSIKRPSDETSAVRSVAERQKLRSSGEKMYSAGLKEAAKSDVKKAAVAGAVGTAAAVGAGAGSSKQAEGKKAPTETKASKEDSRVNPKDYPVYKKKTESAAEFRKAYSKAKEEGKSSFTFEGRKYNTEDAMKGTKKMMGGGMANKGSIMDKKMMGGGMVKKYAKGGMGTAKCGASNPASGKTSKK